MTDEEQRWIVAEESKGVFDPARVRIILPTAGGPNALEAARVVEAPAAFVVKHLGATIRDEGQTPAALGIPDGAGLIVLRARRTAVR